MIMAKCACSSLRILSNRMDDRVPVGEPITVIEGRISDTCTKPTRSSAIGVYSIPD